MVGIVILCVQTACGLKPQIVAPFSVGFSDDEYIVIEVKDKDQLGILFEAVQETDEDGNTLPLRWRETVLVIFPHSKNVSNINTVKEKQIEQTRSAVETIASSSKITGTAIGDLNASNEAAFKYQSKASKFSKMIPPLKYNPHAKRYMNNRLEKNKNYRFAYMSALYEGTAFVELLSNVKVSGTTGYAAFAIDGKYYTTDNQGVVTSGAIIFQLKQIEIDELLEPTEQRVRAGEAAMTDAAVMAYETAKRSETEIEGEIDMKGETEIKGETKTIGFQPLTDEELEAFRDKFPKEMQYLLGPNK